MNSSMIAVITFLISAAVFIPLGIYLRKKSAESKIKGAETEAQRILSNAKKEAENAKKEEILKAKEEIMKTRNELDEEIKERRSEVALQEKRIIQKEENLEKRSENIERRERDLEKKAQENENETKKIEEIKEEQTLKLEQISRLSRDDAKVMLLEQLDKKLSDEKAVLIRESESKAKEDALKNAREIVGYAIQKCAADHTSETTVSVVSLPNDDMKGRIIGREGRNIKTIETLTGIDLIIDDTPDVIVLSSFDPIRREVARIALERLIADGRIHPGKIEEMIEKAKSEVEATIKEEGERALFETGVINVHPDLVKLLGKLKYRTSYGQNVLNHSIEVANIAGTLAVELGIDPTIAKRAGLFHDIGKSFDHDVEGTHVSLGIDLLKKYHEKEEVIWGMEAHHGDTDPKTIEAVLVQIGDIVSASRPGARRETVSTYIKRLQKLEEICNSYKGVDKSYAIQAGREVRLIVKPEEIDDASMVIIARDVAKQIEKEMVYPGQIKVNVIRESRAIDIAK